MGDGNPDLTMKPSLAVYTLRREDAAQPLPTAIESAVDADEALFAVIEKQARVCSAHCRRGNLPLAAGALRLAYVEAELRAQSAGRTPGPRLALAAVRLQSCALLSRFDRHSHALEDARAAVYETEKAWELLGVAAAEHEVAFTEGDPGRLAEPYRRMMREPPRWLEKAVALTVQAKLCVALELEYSLKEEELGSERRTKLWEELARFQREAAALAERLLPPGDALRESALLVETQATTRWIAAGWQATRASSAPEMSVVQDGTEEDASAVIEEGWTPEECAAACQEDRGITPESESSKVSDQCEEACVQHAIPQKTPDSLCLHAIPGKTPESLCLAAASRTDALATFEPLPKSDLPNIEIEPLFRSQSSPQLLRNSRNHRLPVLQRRLPVCSSGLQSGLLSRPSTVQTESDGNSRPSTFGGDGHRSLTASKLSWHEQPWRTPPAKEKIAKRAARRWPLKELFPGPREELRHRTESGGPVTSVEAAAKAKAGARDPFNDYLTNNARYENLPVIKKKLCSDPGTRELQRNMRDEARIFKNTWLRDADTDVLNADRVEFSPCGLQAARKRQRRRERYQKEWHTSDVAKTMTELRKDLFSYYGVKLEGESQEPSLNMMKRALEQSHLRTGREGGYLAEEVDTNFFAEFRGRFQAVINPQAVAEADEPLAALAAEADSTAAPRRLSLMNLSLPHSPTVVEKAPTKPRRTSSSCMSSQSQPSRGKNSLCGYIKRQSLIGTPTASCTGSEA